jgi:hypothetical protein
VLRLLVAIVVLVVRFVALFALHLFVFWCHQTVF